MSRTSVGTVRVYTVKKAPPLMGGDKVRFELVDSAGRVIAQSATFESRGDKTAFRYYGRLDDNPFHRQFWNSLIESAYSDGWQVVPTPPADNKWFAVTMRRTSG